MLRIEFERSLIRECMMKFWNVEVNIDIFIGADNEVKASELSIRLPE